MANQALEQTRDCVLRHGEPGGRELLNLVVRRSSRKADVLFNLVDIVVLPLTGKESLTYTARMVAKSNSDSDVFTAISHPARRQMLSLLAEGDRPVNAIAGHFRMSRPAVSQHLRVLLIAGLVTERRHGRERHYRFVPKKLGPVRDWLAQYERFWDERLQLLQKHLSQRGQE